MSEEILERLARIETKLELLDKHDKVLVRMDQRLDNMEVAMAKRNAYMAGAVAAVSILWGFVVSFFYMVKRVVNGS